MKHSIIIPDNMCDYIEKIYHEKTISEEQLKFMLVHDIHNDEMFNKIQDEYTKSYIEFYYLMSLIESLYIKTISATPIHWEINFFTGEIEYEK